MSIERTRWFAILWLFGVVLATGCAEGPFRLGLHNPMLREEWKKDEQYGPTLHAKLEELATLRNTAASMSADEQQRHSQQLMQILQGDAHPLLATAIIRTLATFNTPESLEALRQATAHGNSDYRLAACQGWGRKQGPEAIEALATVLGGDTDLDVRLAAARELEHFREPAAVQALGAALEANDPAVQYRAVQSLKKVTGRDYGDSVPAWREFVQSGQATPSEAPSIATKLRSFF